MRVPHKPSAGKIRRRFVVSSIKDSNVRERYSQAVLREVSQDWSQEAGGERKWRAIREGMSKAAKTVLGQERRRQPIGFMTVSTPWSLSSSNKTVSSPDG